MSGISVVSVAMWAAVQQAAMRIDPLDLQTGDWPKTAERRDGIADLRKSTSHHEFRYGDKPVMPSC